ncbi:uncharacterized protein LOC119974254 [Scyliorhinus canicula]|uniref:uncharacterized protein LOC119974254 n=1 Tax=Scyliorhinus canicula TaxID=7830 RepID=UPI0018F7CF95|nr:uncharacterized protein LOC119974254 [Scyliorhinus canicula]
MMTAGADQSPSDVQSECAGNQVTMTFQKCVTQNMRPALLSDNLEVICNITKCIDESYSRGHNKSGCYRVIIRKFSDKHSRMYYLEYGKPGQRIQKELRLKDCPTPEGTTQGKEGDKKGISSTENFSQHFGLIAAIVLIVIATVIVLGSTFLRGPGNRPDDSTQLDQAGLRGGPDPEVEEAQTARNSVFVCPMLHFEQDVLI